MGKVPTGYSRLVFLSAVALFLGDLKATVTAWLI